MQILTSLLLLFNVLLTSQDIDIDQTVQILARQNILDRLYLDERTRSEGGSGIKQTHIRSHGTKTYHSGTHTVRGVASIHTHANTPNTLGMGEIIAVLNGVEFRTRHNDYKLTQPSTVSSTYKATQDIDTPDVPPSVMSQPNISAQINEMTQYFKAFSEQDDSVYDFKPYFKPNLCYMEGMWTHLNLTLEESFKSDRHFLDAGSWFQLTENIRYNSYSGSESLDENQAYLPSKVMGMINGSTPLLAQWNYRIMCHPLKADLPTDRFKVIDDIATRMNMKLSLDEYSKTTAARFQLANDRNKPFSDGIRMFNIIDELMMEVPGLDNYGAELSDGSYGYSKIHARTKQPLNSAYYHRSFLIKEKQNQKMMRGFSDPNLFVAQTTQNEILGLTLSDCSKSSDYNHCHKYPQKWTYAIPLEIVYSTPLNKWNPYNIQYSNTYNRPEMSGKNPEKAINRITNKWFYQTPKEFFQDPSDGSGNEKELWVNDHDGQPHLVRQSGHRIILNNLKDFPHPIRLRWPIAPIHGEGSLYQKEIDALKDIMLSPSIYPHMFYEDNV